jgi:radical SAM protein with 4Fe4S-binding SPASM domain
MEWSLFQNIIDQFESWPPYTKLIFQLHNEPLLDKRVFEFVKYVKSKQNSPSCIIISNGEFLDRFDPNDIIQANPDKLVISLNAHSKETYERINVGLSYDRVMKNIQSLISNQSLKSKTTLSFVLLRDDRDEVHRALKYWRKQGIKTRVVVITNRGGALDNYKEVRPTSPYYGNHIIPKMRGIFMTGIGKLTGCPLPFYQMNILFNGDCILCCHDWNRATIIGNAGTASLSEIWNSRETNDIRRLIRRKNYGQIDACKECSIAISNSRRNPTK